MRLTGGTRSPSQAIHRAAGLRTVEILDSRFVREICFVHIGKTGGTSVWRYMQQTAAVARGEVSLIKRRHSTAAQIASDVGKKRWGEALTFSIVRNPFDRFRSACRQDHANPNDPKVWASIEAGTAFEDKVAKHPRHIFVTQKTSLFIDGHLGVDIVFNFENGFEPLVALLWTRGLIAQFGHYNNKHQKPVKLSREACQFVRDVYSDDFKAFGYDKR